MRKAGLRLPILAVALAMLVVAAGGVAPAASASAADYRVRHYDLAKVSRGQLPWTAEPRLKLPAHKPRDAQGVPMYLVDGRRYYRPGALAISGMKRIDTWIETGNKRQLKQALLQASKLRSLAVDQRDAWWLPFRYDYPPAGMRAPWVNAMTQGLAISFFVRLYRVTDDVIHLKAARRVFRSFLRPQRQGRLWVSHVDARGYLWLEHYPGPGPDMVLNAHMHALFGIYEYWQVTEDPKARRVLEGAITTMRDNATRFRRPGGYSLYDLVARTRHAKYHKIHIWQLRLLASISSDPWFWRLADKFARDARPTGYVPGRPAKRGTAPTALPADNLSKAVELVAGLRPVD